MSEGKLYFVVNGLNQDKTWLRSYSWIGVQRLVVLVLLYHKLGISVNVSGDAIDIWKDEMLGNAIVAKLLPQILLQFRRNNQNIDIRLFRHE